MATLNEVKYAALIAAGAVGRTINELEINWLRNVRGRAGQTLNELWLQEFIGGGGTVIGTDMIINGDFATDTDWAKGGGWTIAGGVASCDGAQLSPTDLTQITAFVVGVEYELTYTVVTRTAGAISPLMGGVTLISRSTVGTFTERFTPTQTGNTILKADADFVGTVDNVSVGAVEAISDGSEAWNGQAYAYLGFNGATAQTLNERWYQFWLAGGIVEPVVLNYTVGSANSSATGAALGMHKSGAWSSQGDLTPEPYEGKVILGLNVSNTSDNIDFYFADSSAPYGIGNITLDFTEHGSYVLTWDGINRYRLTNVAQSDTLWAYFSANYALTVPLVVSRGG